MNESRPSQKRVREELIAELEDELADAIPNPKDITRLAVKANLPLGRVAPDAAIRQWHDVVRLADQHGRLCILLDQVAADLSGRRDVDKVRDLIQGLCKDDATAISDSTLRSDADTPTSGDVRRSPRVRPTLQESSSGGTAARDNRAGNGSRSRGMILGVTTAGCAVLVIVLVILLLIVWNGEAPINPPESASTASSPATTSSDTMTTSNTTTSVTISSEPPSADPLVVIDGVHPRVGSGAISSQEGVLVEGSYSNLPEGETLWLFDKDEQDYTIVGEVQQQLVCGAANHFRLVILTLSYRFKLPLP